MVAACPRYSALPVNYIFTLVSQSVVPTRAASTEYEDMSKALAFDNGVPVYHGEAELLEEYIDRVETIQQTWTQDVEKKMKTMWR